MITEFFAFLEDVMIVLLILVGMVLLLFGLRYLISRDSDRDYNDAYNADFRKEIRLSKRVLGSYNLFRRFFDVGDREEDTKIPSVPDFYTPGKGLFDKKDGAERRLKEGSSQRLFVGQQPPKNN